MTARRFSAALALLLAFSAGSAAAQTLVRVTETAGIARRHEPITVVVGGRDRVFFVEIGANETKEVQLVDLVPHDDDLFVVKRENPVGFTVENEVLAADHTLRVRGQDAKGEVITEDSGTLRALTYKPEGVTLLRTQNRMHWAPSFQRAGEEHYASIATWDPVQNATRTSSMGWLRHYREGKHQDYPEIELTAEYQYFAYLPYFLFEATMDIVEPIEMYWLRGQEMTMDGFFTHVVAPSKSGEPRVLTFDERKASLEAEPIAVDAPWIAFINPAEGYGFGAITLAHEATTTAGAFTSINDGAGGGRYWDRHYISRTPTALSPGDHYRERTAYVLFRSTEDDLYGDFFEWEKRIRNPVQVEVIQ